MIPVDVASRAQLATDTALRPVSSSQVISDKLSDLVPGQRLMAEIQALLPNGTYRAMMAQRNVTLALPFTAKAGDTLELEVVESDGKLTLAVLSRPQTDTAKAGSEAVSMTLSRTGQLISTLFAAPRDQRGGALALPLNGNQPIANAPPTTAQDILPLLKQAITQSGMFYESHQAEWVEGRFEKAALLQEPQGKLSPQPTALFPPAPHTAEPAGASPQTGTLGPATSPAGEMTAKQSPTASGTAPGGQLIAQEARPVVQQQLEALATQQFAWQGQVWPGQQMRWEIEENAKQRNEDSEEAAGWQTRLHLALPQLGELEARIRLQGNQIHLDLGANHGDTQQLLRASMIDLRKQLDAAGLSLGTVGIGALTSKPDDAALASQATDGQANT